MYEYTIIAWDKEKRKYVLDVLIEENPSRDSKLHIVVAKKVEEYRKNNPNMVYGWEKHLIPLI